MLLDYRKDIDGLRAVAVLLVTLFHLGLPISGGFVGVDIFFVISGFLIASLIQKQILRDKFTFKGFYLHRMRRILPALITVIVATFIMGWFILVGKDYAQGTRLAIYSLFGFSNIYLYFKGSDYFAQDTDLIQLLHTWSLGVEEQFYFIAPIFLILLFKFTYKTKWFNIILSSLVAIGFSLSHYYALNNPSAAYYLLPSRFFELLMGVILALNYSTLPVSNNKIINNLLALLAFLLIFIPSFIITKQSIFPSYNAFFVCLGSCLIIYLGKVKNKTFITKLLSLKPVVFIGLISYSLYLWHWPVISFFNIVGVELNFLLQLSLLVLFIVLAYLTWRFVENPFRYKFKYSFNKILITLLLIPAVLLIIFKHFAKESNGFENLRLSDDVITLAHSIDEPKEFKKRFCHGFVGNGKAVSKESCYLGDKSQPVTALLYGDSHANSYAGFLEELLIDAKIRSYPLTDASTMYFTGMNYDNLGSRAITKEEAITFIEEIKKELSKNSYKYVILAGYFNRYIDLDGKDNISNWMDKTIQEIIASGSIPVLVKDFYQIPKGKISCPIYNKMYNLSLNCKISVTDKNKNNKYIDEIYIKLEQKYPQMVLIDPSIITCNGKSCNVIIEDKLMFIDNHHIVYEASKKIGKIYLKKYKNPFK